MHTVVFGWFGGSAVWFLPLFWRLVKSALPGGAGLRGPGTIRLWLGFICVLVASCTLEASVLDIVGVVGVDGFGHALAAGLGHLLGHVGTPLTMLALLLISAPWLIGFRWSSVAVWADGAFGLGLSRGLAKRDEDARRHRSIDEGLSSHASPSTNTMAPKSQGRYARPTVWRPPVNTRGAGAAGKDAASGPRGAAAQGGNAGSAGNAAAGWRGDRLKERRPAVAPHQPAQAAASAQAGQAARLRNAAPARQGQGARPNPDQAAWTPTEPVAPAGWLRESGAAARATGAPGTPATPMREGGSQIGRRSAGEQRPVGAAAAMGAAGSSAGSSALASPGSNAVAGMRAASGMPGGANAGGTVGSSTQSAGSTAHGGVRHGAAPAQTPMRDARVNVAPSQSASPVLSGTSVPNYTRPVATTPPVTPPASVQETLRSIEENAARWTTLAGVSLARGSNADSAQAATASVEPAATDTAIDQVPATGAMHIAEAGLSGHTDESTDDAAVDPATVDEAPAHAVNVTRAQADSDDHADAQTETVSTPITQVASEQASVAQWPTETPTIHRVPADEQVPPVELSAVRPSTAAAQPVATYLSTVEHTQHVETTHTPAVTLAPVSTVVIDKSLAPWEAEIDAVTTVRVASSAGAVHATGTIAQIDLTSTHSVTPPLNIVSASEPDVEPSPTLSDASNIPRASWAGTNESNIEAPSIPSNVVRFPGFAASTNPAEDPPIDASDEVNESDPLDEPYDEAPAEPAAPRAPVRGNTPASAFEFRAPSASTIELPTLDLLARADTDVEPVSEEKLAETGLLIEQRLQEFKVPVTVVGASAGPVITRFEVEPALGVRGSQIVGLMKDLSRGLGLTSIRVVETIPGKTCMGLELPNAKRQTIRLSEILEASVYLNSPSRLTLAMGKDITGHPVVADLAKAPHMLVAGTTGSGKSVAINAMICSLLFKATPEEVRLIMIDPKMLELSVYEGIPHLLAPVVTDMKLAANALNWCVGEMEKRYRLMSAVGVRNLAGFNQKIRDTEAAGKKLGNPFSLTPEAPEPLAPLPLIVVVIDELADLMMVAGKKIEELIARLAQKARAAGIHLILATQRPSVDVITGLIKANIPTRVAFQVSSKIDSRTILDQMGAESLLGQGDMLFLPPGTGYPQRVHGAFVADEEVHRIVEYLKQFGEPQYEEGILDGPATEGASQDLFGDTPDAEADPLYDEAVSFVVRTRRASISSVQRQLRIGYNRAARLVEQMEAAGLVSAMGINGSREVLAPGPAE